MLASRCRRGAAVVRCCGFVGLLELLLGHIQIVQIILVVGLQFERSLIRIDGQIQLVELGIGNAQTAVGFAVSRIVAQRQFAVVGRSLEIAQTTQGGRTVAVENGIGGVQTDRTDENGKAIRNVLSFFSEENKIKYYRL